MQTDIFNDVAKALGTFPIDLGSDFSFIDEKDKKILNANRKDVQYLSDNQFNPLKVVLMGEVKAGKSTLINAIIGDTLAPVGATETTSVILEIGYGSEPLGTIFYYSGVKRESPVKEIFEELTSNQKNPGYYTSIEKISLQSPIENLKEIKIVDTPGIGTITEENEQTSRDFIQKSDVIVWVLNVHHLGQASISEKIQEIVDYGKPVILVVNRVDEVDEDEIDEVLEYVEEHYDYLVEEIFPVSAKTAYESQRMKDSKNYIDSGLDSLLDYLSNNVEIGADEQKLKVDRDSLMAIIEKEVILSNKFAKTIQQQTQQLVNRKSEISTFITNINLDLKESVNQELMNFLYEEEIEVRDLLSENKKNILVSKSENLEAKLREYTASEYINTKVKQMVERLMTRNQENVHNSLYAMQDKFENEFSEFISEYNDFQLLLQDNGIRDSIEVENISKNLFDGAKQGAIVGGVYGASAAAYTALLGPYAASVSLGMALSSAVPPVLLVGAATGAAIKFVTKNKNDKKANKMINEQFSSIRSEVQKNLEDLRKALSDKNKEILKGRYEEFSQVILNGSTINDLEKMNVSLNNYSTKLKIFSGEEFAILDSNNQETQIQNL